LLKIINILLISLIIFLPELHSSNNVSIFHENVPGDTIDFGMCLSGKEIPTMFNIRNNGTTTLQINKLLPSYGVEEIDEHPGEFNEFRDVTILPITIPAGNTVSLYIKFLATTGSGFPPRKNTASLTIGPFDPLKFNPPKDTNELEGWRKFVLIARKTIHYIDVFEEVINFDSIYVLPPDTFKQVLILQNSYEKPLDVIDVRFTRSFNAEITVPIKPTPFTLNQYLNDGYQNRFSFSYYPRNMGLDTANIFFTYKPDPQNFPDSVDIRKTRIFAYGVQQDLGVINADTADFTFDSINFGDIAVGDTKEVKIVVRTVGNLPFGAISQKIVNIDSDQTSDAYTLVRKLNDQKYLQPFTTDTLIIRFNPSRSDTVRARLVIESDIFKRKVFGFPDSVRYRTIYLRGVGRQAEIAGMPKEIDFGNIIVNESGDCPVSRDSLIAISNAGNLELNAQSKILPDINTNPFKIKPGFTVIPGRESRYVTLIFDSIANKPQDYEAKLYVISNSPKPKDTIITTLRARGIYPDTMDIRLPANIIGKPGRRISIPILIDKNKISVARIFSDTITYNKSILYFYGTKTSGTASAFAESVIANQDSETGALSLFIKTTGSERFVKSDTLIILEFDTYAGNSISTNLHFVSPKLGDGICARVLSLNKSDGLFSLDSICGLLVKTRVQAPQSFRLLNISPNPSYSDINAEFDIAATTTVAIELYNSYGEKVEQLFKGTLSPGTYNKQIEMSKQEPGLYFIYMSSGIFRDVKRFIYAR
jgi:hypothetical protein